MGREGGFDRAALRDQNKRPKEFAQRGARPSDRGSPVQTPSKHLAKTRHRSRPKPLRTPWGSGHDTRVTPLLHVKNKAFDFCDSPRGAELRRRSRRRAALLLCASCM